MRNRAFLVLCFMMVSSCFSQQVVFIKPITDLFPNKLSGYGKDFQKYYHNSMYAWDNIKTAKFMRSGQALFNQVCDVTEYDTATGEVLVELGNFMVVDKVGVLRPCSFWTLAENLLFLDSLEDQKICDAFPKPVTLKDPSGLYDETYLTLLAPFKGFSIGTRFVRSTSHDTNTEYGVIVYDHKKSKTTFLTIPKDKARIGKKDDFEQDQRAAFIKVLKSLLGNETNFMPYVWGGASYTRPTSAPFDLQEADFFGEKLKYWGRPGAEQQPCSGCDCSGLIVLAAQMVGIPYFFKTTSTLFLEGCETKKDGKILPGDLLVTQGHVAVISDVENYKLIDVAGYGDGYGKMQEVELSKRIDVKDYKELLERYANNKPLSWLRSNGLPGKEREFKIMCLIAHKK